MDYFKRVAKHTPTRFWVNNATRAQARLAVEAGASGCTQNPAYLSKLIGSGDDGAYLDDMTDALLREIPDDNELVAELQRRAVGNICGVFRGVFEATGGREGLVSIQADPFREDPETILGNARRMRSSAPNAIIKVPATKGGLEAVGALVSERVPVLVTEVMSVSQWLDACGIYASRGKCLKDPAPYWIAHITGIFDEQICESAVRDGIGISPDALSQASLILARRIHGYLRERGEEGVHYLAGGARGLHHFTWMVGAPGGVTINWTGTADRLLGQDPPVVDVFNAPSLPSLTDELLEKSPEFRKAYFPGMLRPEEYESFGPVVRFRRQFEKGWTEALAYVASRRARAGRRP